MSPVPAWLRGPNYPKDPEGWPVADAQPTRSVGPLSPSPPTAHRQRVEQQRSEMQRALEDLAGRRRWLQ